MRLTVGTKKDREPLLFGIGRKKKKKKKKRKGFMPTNKRLPHQPGARKSSVGKTLYLIPFFTFFV